MKLEHRKGFKQSEIAFHHVRMAPCRKPASQQRREGHLGTHRNAMVSDGPQRHSAMLSDASYMPPCSYRLRANTTTNVLTSARQPFAPWTTPQHQLSVCDAPASSLATRINLRSLALSLDLARTPVPGWTLQRLPWWISLRDYRDDNAFFTDVFCARVKALLTSRVPERKQKQVLVGSAKQTEGGFLGHI